MSKIAKKGLLYTQTGTPYYASPEVWNDQPYDAKSDVWSIGCILYEMLTLHPPFMANNMQNLFKKVCKGEFGKIPVNYSTEFSSIIKWLLKVKAPERPTCTQVLRSVVVQSKIKEIKQTENEIAVASGGLLGTIQVPTDLKKLKLPKSNYHNDEIEYT